MATEYRRLQPDEDKALIQFWANFVIGPLGGYLHDFTPAPEQVSAFQQAWAEHLATIPYWRENCYLATNESGILSVIICWPRLVRDADGAAIKVGHITHLATRQDMRGRGYASHLLELAANKLRRQGCAFAVLFSTASMRPLFERLDWQNQQLPYRWGWVRWPNPNEQEHEASMAQSGYEVVEYDMPGEGWETLAKIYDSYNAQRPLTLLRNADYWQGFFSRHLQVWNTLIIKAAREEKSGRVVGYIIATTQGIAKYEADLVELGILPGHEAAVAPLMDAGVNEASWIDDGMGLYLPEEPAIERYEEYEFEFVGPHMMQEILIGTYNGKVYFDESRRLMAIPLARGWDKERIKSLCTAAGAVFWLLDDVYKAL